jgi:uncharacterized membrane protein YkvA (DUF1232 family)
MTELDTRCLEAFPNWLRILGDDARALAQLVAVDGTPDPARRSLIAALNYMFKSLDLIPDGIEDLGFIDDAFVFRVAAADALAEGAKDSTLSRLGGELGLVKEFLDSDFARLDGYVKNLANTAARGRTVDEISNDAAVRSDFVREVKSWAESYVAPTFQRDAKTLVKLRSFLLTKLPQ